jgi:nicotinamidase-related amidase
MSSTLLSFREALMDALSLDPQKTALVAIDLQNAVVGTNTAPHSAADVVNRNRQIAEALRSRGGLVVWVRIDIIRFLHLPADQPSPLAGKHLPEELSQIVPEAGRQEGDLLITKYHWGAFGGTPLEQELKARGIDTVILTGISTNIGVESTLRQGASLGLAFVVVEDACAAQDAGDHQFTIGKIFPRLSRVRTAGAVLAALA